MTYPVNFMPWRQKRRAACLRFWSVLFVASLLVVAGLALRTYTVRYADAHIYTVLLQAEKATAAALLASKPRLQQRQQRWQQAQHRLQRRAQTLRWQTALENISALLPEQAWLIRMTYQNNRLELAGKAMTLAVLSELETSLRSLPDFRISHTGATQQDAQGHWQFQYQLIRTQADDRAL